MNTIFYHGSPKLFSNFSLEVKERCTKNETNDLGIWLSNSYDLCKRFTLNSSTDLVASKTDFWDNGNPKLFFETSFEYGGIYTVETTGLKLKEYLFEDLLLEEHTTKLKELEDNLKVLEKEFNLIKIKLYDDYRKYYEQYRELGYKLDALKKEVRILRGRKPEDSFDLFMFDRDKFCKYIAGNKGEVSWKERYCLMNKEEANKEFKEYLKNQGYDGFIIKNTCYDAVEEELNDQICIFNIDKLNITKFDSIKDILTKKELKTLEKEVLDSERVF